MSVEVNLGKGIFPPVPKIDLVIPYISGLSKDDIHYLEASRKLHTRKADASRARYIPPTNHTIKGLIHSAEAFAPFLENIYLVVNRPEDQYKAVATLSKKIKLITHSDFIPPNLLPTYNSNTIEAHLDLIPGLNDCFLLANDDMFFGNRVSPLDFFSLNSTEPQYFFQRKELPNTYPAGHTNYVFRCTAFNTNKLLKQCGTGNYLKNYYPIHQIKPYIKEDVSYFRKLIYAPLSHQETVIRSAKDIPLQLFIPNFRTHAHTFPNPHPNRYEYFTTITPSLKRNDLNLKQIEDYRPKLFCLQETSILPKFAVTQLENFLEKYYQRKF